MTLSGPFGGRLGDRASLSTTKEDNLGLLQQFADTYGREYPRGMK